MIPRLLRRLAAWARQTRWRLWLAWDRVMLRVWYCPDCEGDHLNPKCPICHGTGRRWHR